MKISDEMLADLIERHREVYGLMGRDGSMHTAQALRELQSLRAEVTKLRADSEILRTAGIVEVSIRNASVREYMLHWETRTRNAEVEVEKLRADAEWRPIETAPRDGTEIVVFAPAREGLHSMASKCAWHPDAGFCIDELREPTHWMPLPKPPADAARGTP